MIAICSVLSDAENVDDFAALARVKEDGLRRFLVIKNGIPSQNIFLQVFGALNPKQFEAVFHRWVGGMVPALSRTIAVDGKTLRGSGKGADSPVHRVSALATDLGRVLGQEKVTGKSNEITAIPEWLHALTLKGHLVTIDAMGGQKAIAAQIVAQKGDYLLAVNGNQPTLHAAIQKTFESLSGNSLGMSIANVRTAVGSVNWLGWPPLKAFPYTQLVGHSIGA